MNRQYRLLYLKRKPWQRHTRWGVGLPDFFSITPKPFGSWLYITDKQYSHEDVMDARKEWANQRNWTEYTERYP